MPSFLRLAPGSILEKFAAIANPRKLGPLIVQSAPCNFLEKLFLNKGFGSDLIDLGKADKQDLLQKKRYSFSRTHLFPNQRGHAEGSLR